MNEAIVESLWTYPITGGPGVSVDSIDVNAGGFVGDRVYLLGEEGDAGLQRIGSKQAPDLFKIRYTDDGTTVLLGEVELALPSVAIDATEAPQRFCNEFGDPTPVLLVGPEYDEAFSEYLRRGVKFLRKSGAWQLGKYIPPRDRANATLHVVGAESVEDIANKSGTQPDVRRARGNVVLRGLGAHTELSLIGSTLTIGNVASRSVTQIDRVTHRCPVPGFDPETGENLKDMSLRAMPKAEDPAGKSAASAGVYAHLVDAHGHMRVGDTVTVGAV